MKPAQFNYHRPESIDEALTLLEQHGDEAKILAGGQSLVPLLNLRLASPEHIIDINRINDLDYIRVQDGYLAIGALTRHQQVEYSELVRKNCPLLAECVFHIGHVAIRTRGTVGGSVVHADPTAEIPLVLTVMDGEIGIRDSAGLRYVKPEQFFLTFLTTAIGSGELLAEIRIPLIEGNLGTSFLEVARRHGDFALVSAAAVVVLDDEGTISRVRLGLGGVDGVPFLSQSIPEMLMGKKPSTELIEQATRSLYDEVSPISDLHASETYRREVSVTLARRTLTQAVERATKQQ